ncbi:MAG: hypothetical protein JXA99_09975 [Candidatus Lokiarchaeota archaeon]|nr:hypothetical protein [Candidatus Lokiarchaeota archaeon]
MENTNRKIYFILLLLIFLFILAIPLFIVYRTLVDKGISEINDVNYIVMLILLWVITIPITIIFLLYFIGKKKDERFLRKFIIDNNKLK